MAREKDIQNQILEFLWRLPGCEAWEVNTTGVYDAKKGVFRSNKGKFRRNGVSDIIGFYHGKFFALEVKTPKTKNRVTEHQKFFIEQAQKNDQIGQVVWSVDQVMEIFK